MASLVLTVVAQDRPGLVETLSLTVAEYGANWEDSRMAHLEGRFAGILLLKVEPARSAELCKALRALESQGITVVVEPSEATLPYTETRRLSLEVIGHDRPGITLEIARTLAARGVNVEELGTECVSAPMTGDQMFELRAHLYAPVTLAVDELRTALEAIGNELMVDISLADEGKSSK